jgi:hypothetical protein
LARASALARASRSETTLSLSSGRFGSLAILGFREASVIGELGRAGSFFQSAETRI